MVITVPRPRWNPDEATDEQRQLVEAVGHAFGQAKQWEHSGLAAIKEAQATGVPMGYLVDQIRELGWSQATVYRHLDEAGATAAEPGVVAELPTPVQAAVGRELATEGWTAREFLHACLVLLTKNPKPFLARLAEFRSIERKGRPKKSRR
jgi:hypothetical protein